jgi:hypothetical protein
LLRKKRRRRRRRNLKDLRRPLLRRIPRLLPFLHLRPLLVRVTVPLF